MANDMSMRMTHLDTKLVRRIPLYRSVRLYSFRAAATSLISLPKYGNITLKKHRFYTRKVNTFPWFPRDYDNPTQRDISSKGMHESLVIFSIGPRMGRLTTVARLNFSDRKTPSSRILTTTDPF